MNRILVVEGNPARAAALRSLCREAGFDVRLSPDSLHAVMSAVEDPPDVIVVGATHGDRTFVSLPEALRGSSRLANIPIVFADEIETANPRLSNRCGLAWPDPSIRGALRRLGTGLC